MPQLSGFYHNRHIRKQHRCTASGTTVSGADHTFIILIYYNS
ncbi:MAG TPA: hypothetical protein VHD63_08930 [Ktedonobacteraceae bacterium]|nr:hypothetical protein [Ktedonobacteraceae bacterium]